MERHGKIHRAKFHAAYQAGEEKISSAFALAPMDALITLPA